MLERGDSGGRYGIGPEGTREYREGTIARMSEGYAVAFTDGSRDEG